MTLMSLDALDARIAKDRTDAANLNADALATYTRIRNDNTLAVPGRQKAMARVYLTTKPKVDALKADEAKAVADTQASLRRALFGTANTDPSNLIAYRDAQDRAARLDNPNAAADLMQRALMNEDNTLASAVLEQALSLAWSEVVDVYTDAYPDQDTRLADLMSLGRLNSAQANLNAFFAYHVPVPDELAGMSNDVLDKLTAAGAWAPGQ